MKMNRNYSELLKITQNYFFSSNLGKKVTGIIKETQKSRSDAPLSFGSQRKSGIHLQGQEKQCA